MLEEQKAASSKFYAELKRFQEEKGEATLDSTAHSAVQHVFMSLYLQASR